MCLPSRHRSDREVYMCVYVMILLLGHLPLRPRSLKLSSPATGGNYLVMVRLSEKSHDFPRGWLCLKEHIFIQHRHTLLTHTNTAQTGCTWDRAVCRSYYQPTSAIKRSRNPLVDLALQANIDKLKSFILGGVFALHTAKGIKVKASKQPGKNRTKASNTWEPNLPYWCQRPAQQTKLVFFVCVYKHACASFSVTYDVYITESFVPPP